MMRIILVSWLVCSSLVQAFVNKQRFSANNYERRTHNILRGLCIFVFLFLLLATCYVLRPAFAAPIPATQSGIITTKATVPGAVIIVSGFTSPFASVVLTADTKFITSTTADAEGDFYVQIDVPIKTQTLCLDAIDFKRLGSSQACIDVPTHTTIGLFLPPTIGLLSRTVNAGQNATIYGYSLPRSTVVINSKDGKAYIATTDDTGFYSYTIENIPAGTFIFSAIGEVLGAQSLPPTGGVELKSLSPLQQVQTEAKKLGEILSSYLIPIVLFLLFLVICFLIFLFIRKRRKKREEELNQAVTSSKPLESGGKR